MSDTNNRPRLIEHIHYHHTAGRSSAPTATASGAPTGTASSEPTGNGPAIAFLAIVLLIVLLVGYLGLRTLSSFWNRDRPVEARLDSSPSAKEQGETQRGDTAALYRDQLANWKERRARAQHALARLVSERDRLLDRLLSLGVRSTDDLKNNAVALPLADELAELTGQIKAAQQQIERLDVAIAGTESGLRRLERKSLVKTTASLDEKELGQMAQSLLELKEELRGPDASPGILSEFERDAALNEALRRRTVSQTKE
jgi:hypothetical protein